MLQITVFLIYSIAKSFGFRNNQIELFTDYNKLTNLNLQSFCNARKYMAIFVGPMPHSMKGMEGCSSGLKYLETFAMIPVIKLWNGYELSITKKSLNVGFEILGRERAA